MLLVSRNSYRRQSGWSELYLKVQKYYLTAGILLTNRQIYLETSSIFYSENKLAVIQDSNYFLLEAILNKNLPVVACTRSMRYTDRFAMILNLKAYLGPFVPHCLFQIVLAAQDVEIFCMILYELHLYQRVLPGIKCHMFSSKRLSASQRNTKQALFSQLSLLRDLEKEKADNHDVVDLDSVQELRWTLRHLICPDSFHTFSEMLERRARFKLQQGDPASSAFLWEKLHECFHYALYLDLVEPRPTDEQVVSRIIFLRQQQIEAHIQIEHFQDAHRVLADLFDMLREEEGDIEASLGVSDLVYRVARLEKAESPGRILLFAQGWFKKALKLNPNDDCLRQKLRLIKRRLRAQGHRPSQQS